MISGLGVGYSFYDDVLFFPEIARGAKKADLTGSVPACLKGPPLSLLPRFLPGPVKTDGAGLIWGHLCAKAARQLVPPLDESEFQHVAAVLPGDQGHLTVGQRLSGHGFHALLRH